MPLVTHISEYLGDPLDLTTLGNCLGVRQMRVGKKSGGMNNRVIQKLVFWTILGSSFADSWLVVLC